MPKRNVVVTGAAAYVAGRMLPALRERYDLDLDLRLKGARYRYCHKNTQEYCRERVGIHREILELFKQKNPIEVQEAIRKHIEDLVDWSGWEL